MIRPSAQRIAEFNGVLIVGESARPLSACSHGIIARRDVVSWLLEWLMYSKRSNWPPLVNIKKKR